MIQFIKGIIDQIVNNPELDKVEKQLLDKFEAITKPVVATPVVPPVVDKPVVTIE